MNSTNSASNPTSSLLGSQPRVWPQTELTRVLDVAEAHSGPLLAHLRGRVLVKSYTYPVEALWRATLCKYLLGIRYNTDLATRLRSDAGLRRACGFLDADGSGGVRTPVGTTIGQFFNRLALRRDLVDAAGLAVVDRLADAIDEAKAQGDPRAGRVMVIGSTDVATYSDVAMGEYGDLEAAWGRRERERTALRPSLTRKGAETESFFGYRLHLICDAHWGFPLAHLVLAANESRSAALPRLVDQMIEEHPWLVPEYLVGNRDYDVLQNYAHLDQRGIIPIIPLRELRRGEREQGRSVDDIRRFLREVGRVPRDGELWRELYAKQATVYRLFADLKRHRMLGEHNYRGATKVGLHTTLSVLTYTATMLARALEVGSDGDPDGMRRMGLRTWA